MRPEFKFGLIGGLLVVVLSVGSYIALKKPAEPVKDFPFNGPNSTAARPPTTGTKPNDSRNNTRPTDAKPGGQPVRTPLDAPKPATPPTNGAANPPAPANVNPPANRLNSGEKAEPNPLSGAALNPSPGLLPQEPLTSRPTTIILPEVKTAPPPADTGLNKPETAKPTNSAEPPKNRPLTNEPGKNTDTARRTVEDRGANDGSPKPSRAPTSTGSNQYTIQPGDRLSDIARDHYGDAGYWRQIKEANPGLDENRLLVGKTIVLPPKEAKTASEKAAKSADKSKAANVGKSDTAAAAGTPSKRGALTSSTSPTPATTSAPKPGSPTAPPRTEKKSGDSAKPVAKSDKKDQNPKSDAAPGSKPAKSVDTYTVAAGDTLRGIARRLLGSDRRWQEIYDLNKDKIKSPDALFVGLVLKIPAR